MRYKLTLELIILFIVNAVLVSGTITTGALAPSNADMCGDFANNITFYASNIWNVGNSTLTEVEAKLIIPDDVGLSFLTNQYVELGDIDNMSASSVNPSWTIKCDGLHEEEFEIYIQYNANEYSGDSKDEAISTVNVHTVEDTTAPIIISTAPSGQIEQDQVTLIIETDEDSECRYSETDQEYDLMEEGFSTVSNVHQKIINVTEGSYMYYVLCKDVDNNIMEESQTISFDIISSYEIIDSVSYILNQEAYTVEVYTATKVDADCRIGTGQIYNEMKNYMDKDDQSKQHSFVLTGLNDGIHNYYIGCSKDGNFESKKLIISVDFGPIATININDNLVDPNDPLPAGNYKITLKTNEEIQYTPDLTFSIGDSPYKAIPLEGSGSTFIGYMVIPSSDTEDRVGSFRFKGYDLLGNEGDLITGGTLFLVDTKKPPVIEDIRYSVEGSQIKLMWEYKSHDDVDHFLIYRSEEPIISKMEQIGRSSDEVYIDSDLEYNKNYYYAITAVDDAGNEGEITKQLSVILEETIIPGEIYTDTTRYIEKKTTLLNLIDYYENYLTALKTQIDTYSDEEKSIVEELKLKNEVDFNVFIDQINQLEKSNLDEEAINEELDAIERKIKSKDGEIIKEVIIEEKNELKNNIDEEMISTIILDMLDGFRIDKEKYNIDNYVKKTNLMQKNFVSSTSYYVIKVTMMDNTERFYTYFKKNMELPEDTKDLLIIEVIPKSVAETINDIKFNNKFTTIKRDPIVGFKFEEAEKGISYTIGSNIKKAEGISTIVVKDPTKIFVDKELTPLLNNKTSLLNDKREAGMITGMIADEESKQVFFTKEKIIALIGIIILIGLAYYYFFHLNKQDNGMTKPMNTQKPIFHQNVQPSVEPISYQNQATPKQIHDKQYPLFAKHKMHTKGLKPLHDVNVQIWLKKAHQHINQLDFHNANKYYFMFLSHLQHMTEYEKDWVKFEADRLYHKLNMYIKLHYAENAHSKKDYLSLKEILNHVTKSYNYVAKDIKEEELELMQYILEKHIEYSQAIPEY